MKSEKIIAAWDKIKSSDEIKQQIFDEITQKQQQQKIQRIFRLKLKPLIASAIILVMLVTTAVASMPMILKMLGSDIKFFESDKLTRYSENQEIIKQYSSKVGISAEGGGSVLTIDNIAFDGTFMNVFYTLEKEANIFEETRDVMKKDRHSRQYIDSYIMVAQRALVCNDISFKIVGYKLLHDPLTYITSDAYFESEYELKCVRRYIITEDLPEVFEIEISYWNRFLDIDSLEEHIDISLTIDMSESKVKTLTVKPNLAATITMDTFVLFVYGDEDMTEDTTTPQNKVTHNITIDRVSISPLGNILVFTEAGSDDLANRDLFSNYYICDDKGNFYGKLSNFPNTRREPNEPTSLICEFFGNVPSDVQYLKLIPFNGGFVEFDTVEYTEIASLPKKLKYSDYGNILMESCAITDESITFTYKYDGMIGNHFVTLFDENKDYLKGYSYSWTTHVYDIKTDSYSVTFTSDTSENPIENVKDKIKYLRYQRMNIELLEEQAIIIPLR